MTNDTDRDVIDLNLTFKNATQREIEALELFFNRLTFEDVRRLAHTDDEAYMMLNGIGKAQNALENAGYPAR